jgi:hypothetical protein
LTANETRQKASQNANFFHLARGGEADFCGLCFGEREGGHEANELQAT